MELSFDPGLTATGWCLWKNGEVEDIGTIRPKGDTMIEKIRYLGYHAEIHFLPIKQSITRVAVEQFQGFYGDQAKSTMKSMMIVSCVQGMLLGLMYAPYREIMLVSKGRVSKESTRIRAEYRGLFGRYKKISKDALDAFEIGIAAGFDKRSKGYGR